MLQYKKMRNKVVKLLRHSKQKFISNIAYADTKTFWKSVKLLNKNRDTIPPLQCSNDTFAASDRDKANMLNDFFATCWNTSQPPLTEDMFCTMLSDIPHECTVSPDEVLYLIKCLNVKKANGVDGISAYMLKATAESIASPLAKVFSLSLSSGKFPTLWKSARVVPILKSGNRSDVSNYRPISLLYIPIVSKMLERYVYMLLWDHLINHAPLSVNQWGFQSGRSTVTSLLATTHDWHRFLDQRKDVMCVFFDFQKAFDTVPHRRLMTRLVELGIHPTLLAWLCSYLSRRCQHVVVNGQSSSSKYVLSGVPQGSVLGPLLFLIYIDTILSLEFSESSKISLYADDVLLYKPIVTSSSFYELQVDINNISMWTSINLMSLNTEKCKCMLLTNKRSSDHPPLLLNNQNLEQVKQYKYLGVTISSNLRWSPHIERICKSAIKKLGIIYRNFSHTSSSPHIILQLYLSLVRPSLEYASQVWDPHSSKDVKVLENIQKFALRIATKQYYARYEILLDTFQLPSLENRRSFLSLCTFF